MLQQQVGILVALFAMSPVAAAFQSYAGVGPMKPAAGPGPRIEGAAPENGSIRVDTALVEIPAHVTNAFGATVGGLGKDDFELFEDNYAQTISHFSMDDAPASVGLVYDCSGSMHDKINQSAQAAEAFARTANPEDEFFLVEFGDWPKLASPFTVRIEDVLSRILHTRPYGRTALLDAVYMGMKEMKKAHNRRKALIVLSDGGDNQSRHTLREIENALVESDVQVYAMGLYSRENTRKLSPEERRGPKLLEDISERTGGRLYTVSNAEDLPAMSARISKELRTEYILGFSPLTLTHDGKYHRISVRAKDPALRVWARAGYYDAAVK